MSAHLRAADYIVKSREWGSDLGVIPMLAPCAAVAMANDHACHAKQQHGDFLAPENMGRLARLGSQSRPATR